jgi:DnaJ homolog subfamily B member 4
MAEINYYDILQIPRGAKDAEIKKAYRKLAMKWHPDKNPDSADEAAKNFQSIGEAYDVLSDPENRAIYDQYGYEGLKNGVPNHAHPGTSSDPYSYKMNAQDTFEKFFGTSNPFSNFGFADTTPFASKLNKPPPAKPTPVIYPLECSLSELYNGATKTINITRKKADVNGNTKEDTKLIVINVKPGWKKGTKVTFPNEGDEVKGWLPQDVIFVISEKDESSSEYSRDGNNLIYTYKLSLADALTDCSLQIPTFDSRILSIAAPEVISPEYEKRVVGEGMPLSKKPSEKGDLIIKFHILFPKYLNGAKRNKIRELLANEDLLN